MEEGSEFIQPYFYGMRISLPMSAEETYFI